MTVAEKMGLTEEQVRELSISINKLKDELCEKLLTMNLEDEIEKRLNEQIKPTLTEDERVILRNIYKKYKYITRDNSGNLYIKEQLFFLLALPFSIYNHLFQFIKDGEEYSIEELLDNE